MSKQEALLISAVIKAGTMRPLIREGIQPTHFSTYRTEFEWLEKQKHVPSRETFLAKFPDFRWRSKVKTDEITVLCEGLKDHYVKTAIEKTLERSAKSLDKMTGIELAHTLQDAASEILRTSGAGGAVEIITEGSRYLREFRHRQKNREKGIIDGVTTGIATIDNHTGGLRDAQMYVIIARQGNAKTYLMLRFAAGGILQGKRVLWISREMPDDMVAYRTHTIMSSMMRGGYQNAFSNLGLVLGRDDVDYKDYRGFVRQLEKEVKGRLFIPDNRRLGVRNMAEYIERYSPDVVFYDYLGIVGSGEGDRSWQKLAEEANIAKESAMTYNVPMVVASQVNRAAGDVDEAPLVENIAYSDGVGYAADMVFSLRLERGSGNPNDSRLLEVWMRKARYGAQDAYCVLEFRGDRGSLVEVESGLDMRGRGSDDDDEDEDKPKKKRKSSGSKRRRKSS